MNISLISWPQICNTYLDYTPNYKNLYTRVNKNNDRVVFVFLLQNDRGPKSIKIYIFVLIKSMMIFPQK